MALVGTPVSLEEIKKTCFSSIESINPSSIDWTKVIGQGTYGIILGIIQDSKYVIKIANKKTSCSTLNHEYTLHQSALSALDHIKSLLTELPIVTPSITNYMEKSQCCAYYMSRIFPTSGNKLVHCLIDSEDEVVEKWSGIFPNNDYLTELIEKFQKNKTMNKYIIDINTLAYLNGIIFGTFHFGSKQTAQDIEIVLGSDSKSGIINVYFFDFDKSQLISRIPPEKLVKHLAISMSGGYCKFLGVRGDYFIKGYRAAAQIFNGTVLAEKVIDYNVAMEKMYYDE